MAQFLADLFNTSFGRNVTQMAEAIAHRSDFAFHRSGDVPMGQFATTAGSSSVRRPSTELTPIAKHVAETRRAEAYAKHLAESVGAEVQAPLTLKHNLFGNLTVFADNKQGFCKWNVLSLFTTDVMDALSALLDDDQNNYFAMYNLDWISSVTKFRNQANTQAEVDSN